MRTGKVSAAVLDRSVLRPAAGARKKEEQKPVCSTVCGTVTGAFDPLPEMYFAGTYNKLLALRARPACLAVDILLPETAQESELKQLMQKLTLLADQRQIRIAGGHTQVSEAVTRPVLSITMWSEEEGRLSGFQEKNIREEENLPLVMAGCAGWAGSAVLAAAKKDDLLKRFPAVIADGCLRGRDELFGDRILGCAETFETDRIYALSQGGVFGGLWEMGVRDQTGFETELKKIPIRQETIEVCEWYDLNPYQLYSPGAFLMTCRQGEQLAEQLRGEGIPAEVIGTVHAGRERTIRNGEEIRYLDKPGQDMLWIAGRKGDGR